MREKEILEQHNLYYLLEIIMLLLGLFLMVLFSYDVGLQFIILVFLLLSYIIMGFLHHHASHTFSAKIMIEYVLVSVLILMGFIFLNIGRL